jgi:hypothetical protein
MNQKLICPIAPFSSPGKGDECFFEDFLTNDDINYILARPEWLQSSEGRIGNGHDRDGEVNKDVRTTAISWMARDKDNDYVGEWHEVKELAEKNGLYSVISKQIKKNAIINLVFYIPCLLIDLITFIKKDYKDTPDVTKILFVFLIMIVIVYIVFNSISFKNKEGIVLIDDPKYLNTNIKISKL